MGTSFTTPVMDDADIHVPVAPRICRVGTLSNPKTPPSTFPDASNQERVLDPGHAGSDGSIDYFEDDDMDEMALMLAMDVFDREQGLKQPRQSHVRLTEKGIFFSKP